MVTVLPDYTLIVQMVIFISLIFVLNVVLYKPVLSIIDRRKKQLEELENEIKLFNEAVEKRVAEYEERLRQGKQEVSEQKKAIIQEGLDQAKVIIDAVRNEIPAIAREFQQKMDDEIQKAKKVLEGHYQNLSLEIAQKILGRPIQ